ncbi:MAG TPA: radical SAM protein [Polyangiaceae bacterium]|jgi:MoaA/NifB/PqqE/SkfB family radical SAM enzyme|nr:radical SAM protein [Polyangiaceae bacterium]
MVRVANDVASASPVRGPTPRSTSLRPSFGEQYNLQRIFQVPPPVACRGARMTHRRVQNLTQSNLDERNGKTELASYPIKLTIEATNICNLRCPACFTGSEQIGRRRGHLSLDLYRRVMEELGPYLFEVEFYNWGEPLLGKHIFEMVEEAHRAGASTTISTNFSFPFDDAAAERLVRSGLTVLGVSLDGARQETYEQYRVRGDIARVLDNCRRVAAAKRRLGSESPILVWEFHVFSHNVGDIELAKSMAADLGMLIAVDKGWVVGPDWDPEKRFEFSIKPPSFPTRCSFLWHQAVINNDGGVAPCCGTFYKEDDVGRLEETAGDGGSKTFFEVWNGDRQKMSRALFNSRDVPDEQTKLVCHSCEWTLWWEEWRNYIASGAPQGTFKSNIDAGQGFNFFWNRRPPGTPEERGVVQLRKKPSA